jgi:CDP-glucose 4,6-dehydratase
MLSRSYAGRRVLVTGVSGFKGAWLAEWLLRLGADVHGFSLPPPTDPSLFDQLGLASRIRFIEGDVRDLPALDAALRVVEPELVFHLAAQSLVRFSYDEPVATMASNVMGTVHLLEALRRRKRACAVVVVTSDKCYAPGDGTAHDESDALGGDDPYSASKACTELVAASYRRSFFPPQRLPEHGVALATARAGNVIGPGDWARDRLLPDTIMALHRQASLLIRNPDMVRPWQHVLEPLSGYLWLGTRLAGDEGAAFCDAWNFGPLVDVAHPVRHVVDGIVRAWGSGSWELAREAAPPPETAMLQLSIRKAAERLQWRPVWTFDETVRRTADGYRVCLAGERDSIQQMIAREIGAYVDSARTLALPWASQ